MQTYLLPWARFKILEKERLGKEKEKEKVKYFCEENAFEFDNENLCDVSNFYYDEEL